MGRMMREGQKVGKGKRRGQDGRGRIICYSIYCFFSLAAVNYVSELSV